MNEDCMLMSTTESHPLTSNISSLDSESESVAEYSSSDVTGEMTGHEESEESESHASSDEMELELREPV